LILRRFTMDDAARVLAMSREAGVRAWLPDQVYADEREAADVLRHLIGACDDPGAPTTAPLVLGVVLRADDALIGHVGLSPGPDGVEVGYAIDEAHQGRGLATEAVGAMATWGLATLGLPSVDGIVAADNAGSCRVLEKAGFVLHGEATRPLHGVTRRVRTYRKRA